MRARLLKASAVLLGALLTQSLSPALALGVSRVGVPALGSYPAGATLSLYQLFTGSIISPQGLPLSSLCTSPRTFPWAWSNRTPPKPDPTLGACVAQFEYVTSQHFALWINPTATPIWLLTNYPGYIAYQPPFTFTANVSGVNLTSMKVGATNFDPTVAYGFGYYPVQETTISGGVTTPGSFVISDTAGVIPYGTPINTIGAVGAYTATLTTSATGSATADTITVSTFATEFYNPSNSNADQEFLPINLSNPAAIAFYETAIGQVLLAGFAGLSMDNFAVANNNNEGGYYTGVVTPCASTAWPACGGTYVSRYTQGQYDPTFAADLIAAGRSYLNLAHAYGVQLALNVSINDRSAIQDELIAVNVPDIALIESPTLTGGSGSTPTFETNMATEFAVLAQATKPLAFTDDNGWFNSWGTPYASANSVHQQSDELSLSFALITATPGSFYNLQGNCPTYDDTGCAGPVGTGDIGYFVQPDPLLAPNLGTITSLTAAGTLTAGLAQRTLPGGMAFANTTNGALNYTVPSGTWHDAFTGALVSPGTYTLAAYSGVVLFNY